MRAISIGLGLALIVAAQPTAEEAVHPIKLAQGMCVKTGERLDPPMKLCLYSCSGQTYTLTVRMTEQCPPYVQ